MPNWCSNYITVHHDDPAMMEKFITAAQNECIASTFIPKPDDLPAPEMAGTMSHDEYSWRVSNWGTKWDFGIDSITVHEDEAYGYAETAWSPPVEVYAKLYELGFEIKALWHEGGMGFAGIYESGELTEYDNIEYTEEYLMNEISEDIVEIFNLQDMIPEEELS